MMKPFIVGVGMTQFGRQPESNLKSLAGGAATAALEDAGVSAAEVGAIFGANVGAGLITGQEGVRSQVSLKDVGLGGVPQFNVENACASGSSALHLATHYIASGAVETALVVGYEKMTADDKTLAFKAIEACADVDEVQEIKDALGPEGANRSLFMDFYAEKVRKYLASSGATKEHLAAIAAKNHTNGVANDYAQFRQAQTTEDVLASREIVDPLHLLMCSPISDGGAAVLLASPEWAKARGLDGPKVAAAKLRSDSFATDIRQISAVAQEAYAEAGLTPEDVNVAEVHDGASPGELNAYEDLGFAPESEGWKLVDDGTVFLGGRLPVNPSGGLLARGHPIGATGAAQICELTWQLRGEAGDRQVAGANVAVAHCLGGQSVFGKTTGSAAMSVTILTN
jgi:acetyl-CoA acetyltransferase